MGKYTLTLNYLIKNNIPIWTFEDEVASYFDEYFTQNKWNYLKHLFETKFLYYEIGNETPELWNHYIYTSFLERIEPYKQNLKILTKALEENALNEYSNTTTNALQNSILPYSATNAVGNVSDTQSSQQNSTGYNQSPINIFDNFYQKFKDLDDLFVDGFKHNFMEVF